MRAPWLLLLCPALACSHATDGGDVDAFDAVYDFNFTWVGPTGSQNTTLPDFFIVDGGVISSSDGTLAGNVEDTFGNVTFTGPCPTANGGATYTGILNAGAGPKFGQGSYRCNATGVQNTWRVNNGM